MTDPILLAVAHGSRDPAAAAAHRALIDRVSTAAPQLDVRLGYIDHVRPSVGQALDRCIHDGKPVVVVPLLLSAAAHAKGDIPGAIQQLRSRRGTRPSVTYARVLGPDPLLLRALNRQLAVVGVPETSALVLAAAGSADPDANAEVAKVARLLWEWRGGAAPVEVGFAAATRPTVGEAAERLHKLGFSSFAVATYFLAPGRLPHVGWRQAAGVPAAPVLADTPELAQLVLERYAEAVAGAMPPVNCDTCVYRTSWPGQEHRVGAVQRPHMHPADPAESPTKSGAS